MSMKTIKGDVLRFFEDVERRQDKFENDLKWIKWAVGLLYPLLFAIIFKT